MEDSPNIEIILMNTIHRKLNQVYNECWGPLKNTHKEILGTIIYP